MDGLSPADRPLPNRRPLSEAEARRRDAEAPRPGGAEWLTEFQQREHVAQNRALPDLDDDVPEPNDYASDPAEKLHRGRVLLVGLGVLLIAGLVAVGLTLNVDRYARSAETWASGLRVTGFGHSASPRALSLAGTPIVRPPEQQQATPSPDSGAATSVRAMPDLAGAFADGPQASQSLPDSTPLHVRIVYAPSSPVEGARMDALADLLRRQTTDVANVAASVGATSEEAVVYYFPADAVGALRVAASLSRITKRPEPVALVHADTLPRPGTVEIRLPLNVAKDLSNEGS